MENDKWHLVTSPGFETAFEGSHPLLAVDKVLLDLCVQSLSLCCFKRAKETRSCCLCVNPCEGLGGQRSEHTLGAGAGCSLAQKLMPCKC